MFPVTPGAAGLFDTSEYWQQPGRIMYSPNDSDAIEASDLTVERRLILDGTVHMEELEDVSIPRVKGLVELLSDLFRD